MDRKDKIQEKIDKLRDIQWKIENKSADLESEIDELENLYDNSSLEVIDIIDWFASPHTFDYDKRLVLEQFKHLLK